MESSVTRWKAYFIQDGIGFNHVIDHIGLGDLFAPELGMGVQVKAVVITQVIVAGYVNGLDSRADQKVNEHTLQLSLSTLEVVAADVDVVVRGQVKAAGHERVLRTAVDEGTLLEDGGYCE